MLLVACGDGKPSGVISEEKMKAVLWDVAMAGEYANGYIYYKNPTQNRAAINNELMNEIFRLHDITKKEFDKSLEYYKKNPKILMVMLDSIATKDVNPVSAPPIQNPGVIQPPSGIQSPIAPSVPPRILDANKVDTSSRSRAPVNEL